jgi:hypothetical protein
MRKNSDIRDIPLPLGSSGWQEFISTRIPNAGFIRTPGPSPTVRRSLASVFTPLGMIELRR